MAQHDKLETELNTAMEASVFNEDDAKGVIHQRTKAVQQSRKLDPDKKSIIDHLGKVREIVSGFTSTVSSANDLVSAMAQASEMVQRLF